jgi:DNA-binding CsgD family transcriptional regulator
VARCRPRVVSVLLGRGREVERLQALLAAARGGRSGALVIRGEPGIGKTALLLDAASRAEGMRALRARGVEAEAELPFSGLLELVRPVLARLDRVPERQADALRGALGLAEPVVADRFLIGAALLSLLAAVAEEEPLLCLVDDAHWLDTGSAQALVFAARRLEDERVAVLCAAREGEPRRFDASGIEELRLSGLDREEAAELIARAAGRDLPPAVAERLHRATRGNPLGLIELPAALSEAQLSGRDPVGDPLPVTEAVQAAFARRIQQLTPSARAALLVAAAEPSGEASSIGRACAAAGLTLGDLEQAEGIGLLELVEGQMVFRHPLVRAAAYRGATASARRQAHRSLADAAAAEQKLDRQAWHLAAAALEPDEAVAAGLEAAASRARERSGFAAAAAAFERAASLTPDSESRARRMYLAGEASYRAGAEKEHTLDLLEQAVGFTSDRRLAVESNLLRGQIEYLRNPQAAARFLLEEASKVEARNPGEAAVLVATAAFVYVRTRDEAHALKTAEHARDLAERAGGAQDAFVSVVRGAALLLTGRRLREATTLLLRAPELVEEAAAKLPGPDAHRFLDRYILGWESLLTLGRLDQARRASELLVEEAQRSGALFFLGVGYASLSIGDYRAGNWRRAKMGFTQAERLGREVGIPRGVWGALAHLADIAAAQGAADDARRYAAGAEQFGRRYILSYLGTGALGLVELTAGRYEDAIERYERDVAQPVAGEVLKLYPEFGDLIEAYVRAGRTSQAEARLAGFAEQAEESAWPWALARLAHLRGLLAGDDFEPHFVEALRHHEHASEPFPQARTQLAYGERLRRARRRIDARDQLRAALATFEQLGADPWAQHARNELRASGEHVRPRTQPATAQLTPQELQVALLVSHGATNREAGATLFVSPKTIERHLGSVYGKLSLRSRAELARVVAAEEAGQATSPFAAPAK